MKAHRRQPPTQSLLCLSVKNSPPGFNLKPICGHHMVTTCSSGHRSTQLCTLHSGSVETPVQRHVTFTSAHSACCPGSCSSLPWGLLTAQLVLGQTMRSYCGALGVFGVCLTSVTVQHRDEENSETCRDWQTSLLRRLSFTVFTVRKNQIS